MERKNIHQLAGEAGTTLGLDIQVGENAPGSISHTSREWPGINPLADATRKVRILATIPSLDLSACEQEIQRFNQEAAVAGEDSAILETIAMPYIPKRWWGSNGVGQPAVVLDDNEAEFGVRYDGLIKEGRILRRAVSGIGRSGNIVYVADTPTRGAEPYREVV